MAVVTNLDKIIKLGLGDKVDAYLKSLLDKDSEAVKRIYALTPPSFVRFDITDDIFAIEQTFFTKDRKDCFFESHKKYVDIQIVIGGLEQIELANVSKLTVDKPFDSEKDLITYNDFNSASRLTMGAYDAAIFYPEDAHLCVSNFKDSERVYKTVLKVPVSMI